MLVTVLQILIENGPSVILSSEDARCSRQLVVHIACRMCLIQGPDATAILQSIAGESCIKQEGEESDMAAGNSRSARQATFQGLGRLRDDFHTFPCFLCSLCSLPVWTTTVSCQNSRGKELRSKIAPCRDRMLGTGEYWEALTTPLLSAGFELGACVQFSVPGLRRTAR